MGPINTRPVGLLTLLGLQQQGDYPPEFADTIAGTLNMEELLYQNISEQFWWEHGSNVTFVPQVANLAVSGIGGPPPQLVDTERYLVVNWSMSIFLTGAGSTVYYPTFGFQFLPGYNPLIVPPCIRLVSTTQHVCPAGASSNEVVLTSDKPFLCTPGMKAVLMYPFGFTVGGASPGINTIVTGRLIRLKS